MTGITKKQQALRAGRYTVKLHGKDSWWSGNRFHNADLIKGQSDKKEISMAFVN